MDNLLEKDIYFIMCNLGSIILQFKSFTLMPVLRMNATNDLDIRKALHRKLQKRYGQNHDKLIIDELALEHGKNRIDIAVFDKLIHGYEIKSSKDNLLRLENQLAQYSRSLQKVTFVVAENHLEEVLNRTPEWCGVTLVKKGPKGGIHFNSIRRAKVNPNVEFISLAHILWKSEAIDILSKCKELDKIYSYPRKVLYQHLSDSISIQQLAFEIKFKLKERGDWKVALPPLSYGG